jgi:hypothetical protein
VWGSGAATRQNTELGVVRRFAPPQEVPSTIPNVTDFIEEQSALVGNLEAARLAHDGAGKCASFLAKKLAFK